MPEPPAAAYSTTEFVRRWREHGQVTRDAGSRFLYLEQADGTTLLFANGEALALAPSSGDIAARLCQSRQLRYEGTSADAAQASLLCELYNRGALYFEHE